MFLIMMRGGGVREGGVGGRINSHSMSDSPLLPPVKKKGFKTMISTSVFYFTE